MKRLTLRGIDEELEQELHTLAERWSCSVNAAILRLLRQATGLTQKKFGHRYHDLDDLAGTWSEEEKREFDEAIAPLSRIDEKLWE